MVFSVGPTSACSSNLYVIAMKLIRILVILCQSTYKNNSNFLPLLIALYLYFADAQVDTIILLNHLGLFILYPVLLKKFYNITSLEK